MASFPFFVEYPSALLRCLEGLCFFEASNELNESEEVFSSLSPRSFSAFLSDIRSPETEGAASDGFPFDPVSSEDWSSSDCE